MIGVLALFRDAVGRRIYILLMLMPLATLSESIGIALLLPLMGRMDSSLAGSETGSMRVGGMMGRLLARLPLPETPAMLLVLIGCAFVVKAAIKFAAESLQGYFDARLIRQIRIRLVKAYSNLDYSAYSSKNTGHYINVVNGQVNRVARSFTAIAKTAMQIASSMVYLAIASLVNWRFALIAVIAGMLFMLTMKTLTDYVRRLSRATVEEQTILNKQLVQILHALKYLMATARADALARHVNQSCHRLFGHQVRTNIARSLSTSIREPISVGLVLGLIAIQILYFQQPLGVILVALLLLDRATKSLLSVQGQWQLATEMIGSVESVQDEVAFSTAHHEKRGQRELAPFHSQVEFDDVSFAYDAKAGNVLQNVQITLPRNQTIALVGHSGAGKSTLADLLTLLLKPTDGRVLIDGIDVSDIDPRTWRRQLGYVCQETVIFDDTVAGNICIDELADIDSSEVRERIQQAAHQAFAHEFIDALPSGYDTVVGDRGVRLSGGQRQRLFIARELFKSPSVLILDEATSALDSESERAIQESIDALRGQMTVVIIAHRLATIRNADYIYVLDSGRVVEHGPYEKLNSETDSTFRRMVELQSLA